jgi:hypothetical protein
MAEMTLLCQPYGTWISLETLKLASRYLDQLCNTWVNLKVFRSAIEHLGHDTIKLASRYLDPMEHLGPSWQTQEP